MKTDPLIILALILFVGNLIAYSLVIGFWGRL